MRLAEQKVPAKQAHSYFRMTELFIEGGPPCRAAEAPEGRFIMHSRGYLGSNSVHNVT